MGGIRPGMQQMQINPMMNMNNMGGNRPPFNNGMQQPGYKIGNNVRNADMNNAGVNGLNQQMGRMEKGDQKQAIGELLYPKVKSLVMSDDRAGKITGMLLELDNEDLLSILEPAAAKNLRDKVNEAAP